MKRTDAFFEEMLQASGIERHPKCKLYFDAITGEYDCRYKTALLCEDCKYGMGRKDPEAKCNRL